MHFEVEELAVFAGGSDAQRVKSDCQIVRESTSQEVNGIQIVILTFAGLRVTSYLPLLQRGGPSCICFRTGTMAVCRSMKQRQLELWDDNQPDQAPPINPVVQELNSSMRQVTKTLVQDQSAYVSLKRVSLVHEGAIHTRPALTDTAGAKEFFANYWRENPGDDQEKFVVACLDTKNRVQCVVLVSIGTLDASLVHPREVFKPAIIEGASAVILSHNHPSGDATPSKEDRAVTKRLTDVGELLGITVLDHIIHGDSTNEVLSMQDE